MEIESTDKSEVKRKVSIDKPIEPKYPWRKSSNAEEVKPNNNSYFDYIVSLLFLLHTFNIYIKKTVVQDKENIMDVDKTDESTIKYKPTETSYLKSKPSNLKEVYSYKYSLTR